MIEQTNPTAAIIIPFHQVPFTIFVGKALRDRIINIAVARETTTPRITNNSEKIENCDISSASLVTSPKK